MTKYFFGETLTEKKFRQKNCVEYLLYIAPERSLGSWLPFYICANVGIDYDYRFNHVSDSEAVQNLQKVFGLVLFYYLHFVHHKNGTLWKRVFIFALAWDLQNIVASKYNSSCVDHSIHGLLTSRSLQHTRKSVTKGCFCQVFVSVNV